MKIALSWLEEYLIDKPNWSMVFDKLTQAGIEIESVEDVVNEENNSTDRVVELKITPNRGDCLSVLGLLREISVLTNYRYNYKYPTTLNDPQILKRIDVQVDAKDACPNYVGIVIEGVDNSVKLPEFITTRLLLSGYNSISPIVDIANYVMLEIGQPLHTFDLDKLGNSLCVRMARNGETLALLDGNIAQLKDDTLIIADINNNPAAIAGVIGGLDSGVSDATTNIVIESAFFKQDVIAGKAKEYGVNSDAAYRFERGVDYKIQDSAITLANMLITKYLGGRVGRITTVDNLPSKQNEPICLYYDDFKRLIGINIEQEKIKQILSGLGCELKCDGNQLQVTAPSYRFDITIKADVIEEVARVYGYDNIDAVLPVSLYTMQEVNSTQAKVNILKNNLVGRGYNEIISYAFLEEYYATMFNYLDINLIKLINPIAGFSCMRTTLFAGLVKTMQYNVNRGATTVKLFELARVFYGEDHESQPLKLSGLLYGDKNKPSWNNSQKTVDFFDIKGDVELLLQCVPDIKFTRCIDNPVLHSGRCAKIYSASLEVGVIGQLHPSLVQDMGLTFAPYLFELDINSMINRVDIFKAKPISKFQKVERDLAFIVDDALGVGLIVDYIYSMQIDTLNDVSIFDIYSGTNIAVGHKSVAIKLLFQSDDKTLTEHEINISLQHIIESVSGQFNIKLR